MNVIHTGEDTLNTLMYSHTFLVGSFPGNPVCLQHQHHHQDHHEHVHAAAPDQDLCEGPLPPGGAAQGVCVSIAALSTTLLSLQNVSAPRSNVNKQNYRLTVAPISTSRGHEFMALSNLFPLAKPGY